MGVTTDTRARMILSAALLIREHGVNGTSIPKVLEHSKGPRGSVAHHFPGGRTELLTEALRFAAATMMGALSRRRDAGASPAELFDFLTGFFTDQLASTDFTAGCPVGAAAQDAYDDPAIGPVVAEIIEEWIGFVADSLVEAGSSREEADDLALFGITALEGAILVSRVQRSVRPLEVMRARIRPLL